MKMSNWGKYLSGKLQHVSNVNNWSIHSFRSFHNIEDKMVKLNHSLASVSNALNHQIGSLHVIEDGIIQLDKIMGTTRIFLSKIISAGSLTAPFIYFYLLNKQYFYSQIILLKNMKWQRHPKGSKYFNITNCSFSQ